VPQFLVAVLLLTLAGLTAALGVALAVLAAAWDAAR
jgi:hypothetical protein